jgi:hypothetical protein
MDLQERKEIARYLLSKDDVIQHELEAIETLSYIPPCVKMFDFDYPDQLKPIPLPIKPKPSKSKALPRVDVVVVTWTVAEQRL